MNNLKIVYTSETGTTAEYARMLGEALSIPVYTLREAENTLTKGDSIIYLGWLMAGSVKNYKKAAKLFSIKAVCAVGLCETGTITEDVRRSNSIPENTAVFTLQGGYAPDKLRGMNKFMMKIVTRVLVKKIDEKSEKTDSDIKMRETLINGGSYVSVGNLDALISHFNGTSPA